MSEDKRTDLYKMFPFLRTMTKEERSDWYADMYEQYKSENPEEHEEYVR